ncbi:aldehyde dehydrogenase (NADP(+)) [Gordonia rhizosphera]|uniref:Putative aldehyde dehydrogenase n=1 Tax=Gordonia rhizosphera NBRC 16068 TaxID=1108045 RepID=K6V2E6_9ACTN|nr:aldehyde dehydrogenase (NADP(+)) [Gordonia rhizosphera]GAB90163.1 putative aldehyde dehydrogenase [Gordonia rhizosphera NBRC 16068]
MTATDTMTVDALLSDTTTAELEAVLTAAADCAPHWESVAPRDRARVLNVVADALEAHTDRLVRVAQVETGLPEARLSGEVKRTCVQLRMFADELIDGGFLDVIVDHADPDFALGPRPDLRRYQIPIGPVLVFAASNFPFAFSVAGTDTASALAAGCPVIIKAHPGHPQTSADTAAVVTDALRSAGAPDGVFALIAGVDAGVAALQDNRITAAAFTGSVAGGRALFDIAAARPIPITFFGELGSVNPVIVTAGALHERAAEIADGFVGSFTLGAGQFCTKPGILLVPAGSTIVDAIVERTQQVSPARMLTSRIVDGYRQRLETVTAIPVVTVLVEGRELPHHSGVAQVSPTLLAVSVDRLVAEADTLFEETFGPTAIVVEYHDDGDLCRVLQRLHGTLTVTVHTRTEPTETERAHLQRIISLAASRAGRLVFNGWPTGVAVTAAQHHGGPYPATTAVAHTSVGTTAMRRFLRPITYQDAPVGLLPDALR